MSTDKIEKIDGQLNEIVAKLKPEKSSGVFDMSGFSESVQIDEAPDYSEDYDISTDAFNPFDLSVRNLESWDIEETVPAKKKRKLDAVDFMRYAMLMICVGVFVYAAYNVVSRLVSYNVSEATYDEIREIFNAEFDDEAYLVSMKPAYMDTPSPEVLSIIGAELPKVVRPEASDQFSDSSRLQMKISRLQGRNADVVGWIDIAGTKVEYPLVQGEDNEYYLRQNADKKYDYAGSIFLDYRLKTSLQSNRNSVIYGHNMIDRSMFGDLPRLRWNRDMFLNTPIIIYTGDCIYEYEMFSFYQTVSSNNYWDISFSSDREWLAFIRDLYSRSWHVKELAVPLSAKDTIITLSTCTNGAQDGRYAVHARLVKVTSDDPEKAFDITKQ